MVRCHIVRLAVGETHCRVRLARAEVQSHTGGAVLNCSSRMKYVISMPTTCRVKRTIMYVISMTNYRVKQKIKNSVSIPKDHKIYYQHANNMYGKMDHKICYQHLQDKTDSKACYQHEKLNEHL